jgi:hypothetical protein
MIFQSFMGLKKPKCDILSGTTQGQDCPVIEKLNINLKMEHF